MVWWSAFEGIWERFISSSEILFAEVLCTLHINLRSDKKCFVRNAFEQEDIVLERSARLNPDPKIWRRNILKAKIMSIGGNKKNAENNKKNGEESGWKEEIKMVVCKRPAQQQQTVGRTDGRTKKKEKEEEENEEKMEEKENCCRRDAWTDRGMEGSTRGPRGPKKRFPTGYLDHGLLRYMRHSDQECIHFTEI